MASSEKPDNANVMSNTSIKKKVFEQWTATGKVLWIYTIWLEIERIQSCIISSSNYQQTIVTSFVETFSPRNYLGRTSRMETTEYALAFSRAIFISEADNGFALYMSLMLVGIGLFSLYSYKGHPCIYLTKCKRKHRANIMIPVPLKKILNYIKVKYLYRKTCYWK